MRSLSRGGMAPGVYLGVLLIGLAPAAFGQRYRPELRNRLAPYVTSPQRAVDKMLEMAVSNR